MAQIDAGGTHWTFGDHLGTPLIQTDATASVSYQAEYEPYGKIFALRAGDLHQPLRLPGQVAEQFDTGANGATERSYNAFRWHRPGWGRYSQADPIGLTGGFNVYAYAGGSPISTSDPSGLSNYIAERPLEYPEVLQFLFLQYGHSYWIIDPFDKLKGDQTYNGPCIITLAAYDEIPGGFGRLVSTQNAESNSDSIHRKNLTYVPPPPGSSDNDLSLMLLRADFNYRQTNYYKLPYYAGPVGFGIPGFKNSNGYTSGLGSYARTKAFQYMSGWGRTRDLTDLLPVLFDDPVDTRYFEPKPGRRANIRLPSTCGCN